MRLIENGYEAQTRRSVPACHVEVTVTPTWFVSRFAAEAFTLVVTSARAVARAAARERRAEAGAGASRVGQLDVVVERDAALRDAEQEHEKDRKDDGELDHRLPALSAHLVALSRRLSHSLRSLHLPLKIVRWAARPHPPAG